MREPRYILMSKGALEALIPSWQEFVLRFVGMVCVGLMCPAIPFLVAGIVNKTTIWLAVVGGALGSSGIWLSERLRRKRIRGATLRG